MLRTWLCGICLAAGLIGGRTAAWASAYPEADRYYAVRDANSAVKENVTFAQVQANAGPCWVWGEVSGMAADTPNRIIVAVSERRGQLPVQQLL